ncbi:MAG TPA: GNAT family N-acetyltransferase [Gammaproteobacteria bacterium]|nr:GNAT family N-acetyltransferase [Gammaproteobacteria bacterium]
MLQVRRAGIGDLDRLVPLFEEYRHFYGRESPKPETRAFLRERIEGDESVVFLAMLDALPAGFTQLYPLFSSVGMSRIWLLNDLYVVAAARRRGVASALLDAAETHARKTGATALLLQTGRDNYGAQTLYERKGWIREDDYCWYDLAISPAPPD